MDEALCEEKWRFLGVFERKRDEGDRIGKRKGL